jgi:hypothetical protein
MASVNFTFAGDFCGSEAQYTANFECGNGDVDLVEVTRISVNGSEFFNSDEMTLNERNTNKHMTMQFTLAGERACVANPKIWPAVYEQYEEQLTQDRADEKADRSFRRGFSKSA